VKGFVFAAGLGERLRPLTDETPKPLVPVVNVPSICYALMLLKEAGITDVIINLHYRPAEIVEFLAGNGGFGLHVTYSREKTILGTGGGLKNCEAALSGGDFAVVNSDVVSDIDLSGVIRRHLAGSAPATVVVRESARAREIGPVAVAGDRVLDFRNALGTGLEGGCVYTGIAVLSPRIFPHLVKGFSSVVYTGYTGLIKERWLACVRHEGVWLDVGSVESYWSANAAVLRDLGPFRERMRVALGIMPEPVAADAVIGRDAVVERSVVGGGCRIGTGAVVRDSVILPGVTVPERAVVESSVVYKGGLIKIGG